MNSKIKRFWTIRDCQIGTAHLGRDGAVKGFVPAKVVVYGVTTTAYAMDGSHLEAVSMIRDGMAFQNLGGLPVESYSGTGWVNVPPDRKMKVHEKLASIKDRILAKTQTARRFKEEFGFGWHRLNRCERRVQVVFAFIVQRILREIRASGIPWSDIFPAYEVAPTVRFMISEWKSCQDEIREARKIDWNRPPREPVRIRRRPSRTGGES